MPGAPSLQRILRPWSAQAPAADSPASPAITESRREVSVWWDERTSRIRASYGDAITVAGLLCALAVLAVASRASAQTPLRLPATNVTVPAINYNPGQDAKIKGLIISRDGDDMTVRDEGGYLDVVTLTEDTKISSPSGVFKTDKKHRDVTSLLPGLIVEVKGSGGQRGNLVAKSISFHSSALRTAEQIAAGTVALSMRVSANTDSIEALKARVADSLAMIEARARDSLAAIHVRFDDLDKYSVRDSVIVNFNTGAHARGRQEHARSRSSRIRRTSTAIWSKSPATPTRPDARRSTRTLSERRAQWWII